MLDNYLTLENAQFEIRHIEGERQFAQETIRVLSDGLIQITRYFRLSKPFSKVRVVLVTSRDEFDRLVRDLLCVEIEVPSHPARIAQPQRTDMVIISPSAYETHSLFKYNVDQFGRLLVHEFVHMVEEYLSPNIEAIPRWWGEGLAVYLSEQWLYDDEFIKPAFDSIAQNEIPGFHQIELERKLAYDWGWTIVWFIEANYGSEMILQVVKECVDGNVFSMVDAEVNSLEIRWKKWLLRKNKMSNTCST